MLTGKAKIAGVIGWPVTHSLSPVLHQYWLDKYKIDGAMVPLPATREDFSKIIDGVRRAGFRGVNVTVPHKEAAFAVAHDVRPAALLTGAANLLVFQSNGRIGADNTDATGLFDSLQEKLGPIALAGKNIVLLGAGGAARGAAYGLHTLGHVAKITILNRNKGRADQLVSHINAHLPAAKFETGTLEDWHSVAGDTRLVINTTSAGMKGNPPLNIDLSGLQKGAAVCDIVYNPLRTSLLEQAEALGFQTIDGLGMLMHQAAPSFQAFFYEEMGGKAPEVTQGLRDVLVKALKARG